MNQSEKEMRGKLPVFFSLPKKKNISSLIRTSSTRSSVDSIKPILIHPHSRDSSSSSGHHHHHVHVVDDEHSNDQSLTPEEQGLTSSQTKNFLFHHFSFRAKKTIRIKT